MLNKNGSFPLWFIFVWILSALASISFVGALIYLIIKLAHHL